MIPTKLQKEEFSFIKLKGKIPQEYNWQQNKKNTYKDIIKIKGYNIGIVCGFGGLLVLDFDDKKVEEKYIKKLPTTFTVETGTGGKHLYYFTDDTKSTKYMDNNKETLIDVQGTGKQVVCPPSIHPETKKEYKVIKDEKITFITRNNLNAILFPLENKKEKKNKSSISYAKQIKEKLNIVQVLNDYGINTNKNPTSCLWHNSKSGSCFSFDENEGLWHCFHCDKGGDIIKFVEENDNLPFKEASKKLIKDYNLNIEIVEKATKETTEEDLRINFLSLIAEKKNAQAKDLIVDYFLTKYTFKTIIDDKCPEMYIYDKGIYKENGIFFIKNKLNKIFGKILSVSWSNEIIDGIKYLTGIEKHYFFKEMNPDKIPVENGILDLKNNVLLDFSPDYIFFNKLPIIYNPRAECPKINNFLGEIVETSEEKELLHEIFGFVLYKKYFIEKAIMLHGKGCNGKSKFIQLIKTFLGEKNFTGIPLQDLEEKNFTTSQLFKKMANLSGEVSKKALTSSATFKMLTGRDLITADRKFLQPVSYINYAKLIFSCNELPISFDDTEAFWRRWELINFPYKFVDEKKINKNEDNTWVKIKNPFIIDEITSPEELSGLLNEALKRVNKLKNNSDFIKTKTQEQLKHTWKLHTNSFDIFLSEKTEKDFDCFIDKEDLMKHYLIYCQINNLNPSSKKMILSTLQKKGYYINRTTNKLGENYYKINYIKFKQNKSEKTKQMENNFLE